MSLTLEELGWTVLVRGLSDPTSLRCLKQGTKDGYKGWGRNGHLGVLSERFELETGVRRRIAVEALHSIGQQSSIRHSLEKLALRVLTLSNRGLLIKEPVLWRSICRYLSPELLVAIRWAKCQKDPTALDDQEPLPVQDAQWPAPSDPHVHWGAVIPTCAIWMLYMGGWMPIKQVQANPDQDDRADDSENLRFILAEAAVRRWRLCQSMSRGFRGLDVDCPETPTPGATLRWNIPPNLSEKLRERNGGIPLSFDQECVDPYLRSDTEKKGTQCLIIGERQLLVQAWNANLDSAKAGVFWRYIELQSRFVRWCTYQTGAPGLDRFCSFYGARRSLLDESPGRSVGQLSAIKSLELEILEWQVQRHKLERADVRIQMQDTDHRKAFSKACSGRAVLSTIRWVLSFQRSAPKRGGKPDRLGLVDTDRESAERASSLIEEFAARPQDGVAFSAIDMEGREIDSHPARWVEAIRAAHKRKLAISLHTGEDFPDLLFGLRRVSETLDLLDSAQINRARLSHMVSVRVNPPDWYAQNRLIFLRSWDHLLDLLWLCSYTRTPNSVRYIQKTFGHKFSLCGKAPTLQNLCGRYHQRLPLCDCKNDSSKPHGWLEPPPCTKGWCEKAVLFTPPPSLVHAIARAQKKLRRRLIDSQHIVECCPTSNSLIGASNLHEELFRRGQLAPMAAIFGSDDPGCFSTNTLLEEAILKEMLCRQGFKQELVQRRLRQARTRALSAF